MVTVMPYRPTGARPPTTSILGIMVVYRVPYADFEISGTMSPGEELIKVGAAFFPACAIPS